jgi:predicted transcriptional regulator
MVRSLISKEQVQAAMLNEMMEKTFEGSVPAFVAAFTKQQKLSEKEIDSIQQMIDSYRNGEK